MKTPDTLNLPTELRYTAEHVWIRKDGETYLAGISDYAQDQLGEVVFVDLTGGGSHLDAGEEFGSVESVKSVNSLYMPVSGTIVEVNAALEDAPILVNSSCYGDGWLVRLKVDDAVEVGALNDAETYRSLLK
ncbi:glycine cleavage system protein GcvH [Desulfovibrio sp.]|uniref:glycine cleavage system protein GcvH n=1 Tax=Desulfovibrio sp. TaxID=885 RepID=UPI0025BD0695|nr:glycine cleavage system protein GcvH [Desulfovibrio sp.]